MLLFSCMAMVFAQNRVITGKVTDQKDGSPLPGVSVTVKGVTGVGTQTDINGSYKLSVPATAKVLAFNFLGYLPHEVSINGANVNVQLTTDSKVLNEVVVVGYGTQSKRSLTGSVSKIKGGDIENIPVPSLESAIQGRSPGVYIQAQNGKLGQGIQVRVRGASSVSAGSQPLYVVDGLPITVDDFSSNGASTNPLVDLNQNDIESIDILKDASAAAIYGSRASNGVVLVTTKKGKAGSTKITYNQYYGFSKPTREREFLNSKEYLNLVQSAAVAGGLESYAKTRLIRYAAGNTDYANTSVNTNWQDQITQHAPVQNYNLVFSGGTEKTKFYISGTYNDQKGWILKNQINQYSLRTNIENQANNWLTIGANLSVSRTQNHRLDNDNAFSTPEQIVALSPITPVIDPRTGLLSGQLDPATGLPNSNFPVYFNPLLNSENSYFITTDYRNLGNVFGEIKILPSLTFRSEVGVDILNSTEDNYSGSLTARNSGTNNGVGFNSSITSINFNTNNFLHFLKDFGKSTIDAVGGMTYQRQQNDLNSLNGEQFPSDAYKKLTSSASITSALSSSTAYSLLSYFARANYKYHDRYLLSVSGRIDGSSRFGADHRYGFFPAGSVGWIVSEEGFMKKQRLISDLKLRGSYGLTGNSEIGNFPARGLYTEFGYAGVAGARPTQLPNPDLKWETTAQTDIGLDIAFLGGRLAGQFDVYLKKTKDLLLNVQVPATSGFTTITQNLGKLQNKGLEIQIDSKNLVGKVTWNTSFNISFNRNKITDLKGQIITGSGDAVNRAMEGQPLGIFVAPEFAGADPANGDALYYKNADLGNGKRDRTKTNDYNQAVPVVVGNPNPKYIAGLNNSISYMGIDFSFLIQSVNGNQIYNGGGQYMSVGFNNGFDNQTRDQLQAWTKPGQITNVPQARLFGGNGVNPSSRFLDDGSYVRLKNVVLGYNFPKAWISKIKLSSLRVYAQATNLATWTKYKGWDPELNSDAFSGNITQGYDFYAAPQAKTITFGINVGF
ncbi:SusC/RagA family TonB-linked outer membrane protein [Mucilaginibacter sp. P25]|uniref:TonB-linked outer membrane protein, SusC/RagA family n=2 Tax=Mucilaginibacter gossypii TaxID=551996 RepID=A0A1G8M9K0_9SPHI|nr:MULTISPECIES: TonB-dependent receptor [Mucilaginibacter]QTE37002.2 TonB-dependent receptor [Mucilaginibacter gossypii]SDI64601.1 TonB-linked outer membrane protein, SusC/RagA family [Mucilaginibacter gossypii]